MYALTTFSQFPLSLPSVPGNQKSECHLFSWVFFICLSVCQRDLNYFVFLKYTIFLKYFWNPLSEFRSAFLIRQSLVVMNSFNFSLFRKVFINSSFLKDTFTGFGILDWGSFFFKIFETMLSHSLLARSFFWEILP